MLVEVAGPLQVGQVADAAEHDDSGFAQAADEFVGDRRGGKGVSVPDADERAGVERGQQRPVVGALGSAAQRRCGAQRVTIVNCPAGR